jgi:hypothetical protein
MSRRQAEHRRARYLHGCLRGGSLLSALVVASGTAWAFPTARLEYERSPGTESCPDQATLVAAVAERLGYDPFSSDALQTLHARIEPSKDGFAAVIELRDAAAQIVAERRLGNAGGCAELAAAMALSMSIVIDPERALERAPTPSDNPSREASPSADPPTKEKPALRAFPAAPFTTAPPAPRSDVPMPGAASQVTPTLGNAGAALHLALGLEPAAALGLTVFAGARRGRVSFALEARYDAPASDAISPGGRLAAEFFGAGAVPCFHYRPFAGCAVILAGLLRVESTGVPGARADAGFFAGLGPRLGLEWPIAPHVSVFAQGDLLFSLRPLTVKRGEATVWESPLASGRLASGFVAAF